MPLRRKNDAYSYEKQMKKGVRAAFHSIAVGVAFHRECDATNLIQDGSAP